jgi:hypothetical protein
LPSNHPSEHQVHAARLGEPRDLSDRPDAGGHVAKAAGLDDVNVESERARLHDHRPVAQEHHDPLHVLAAAVHEQLSQHRLTAAERGAQRHDDEDPERLHRAGAGGT